MITRAQAVAHNEAVIKDILQTLVENHMADPYRMLTDHEYTSEQVFTYLKAANMARNMMNMPPLVLYDIRNIEEDE